MPKNNGSRRDGCLIPFHNINTAALVTGVFNISVSPSSLGSSRLTSESDAWACGRLRSLRFRLHPFDNAGAAAPVAAAYVGAVQDTPPGTIATALEVIPSCYLAPQTTLPTEWVSVPKADLAGPLPWYKTVAGSTSTEEEVQGLIVVVGTSTNTFALELRGVYEFKTAVSPSNTPAAVLLRSKILEQRHAERAEKERQRLLSTLSLAKGVFVPTGAVNSGVKNA